MEKLPSYILLPSLEQMALRRIAVDLYREPRILASLAKYHFRPEGGDGSNIWAASNDLFVTNSKKNPNDSIAWRLIVEHKISELKLPKSLSKQMKPVLKAVGSEIFTWKTIHKEYLSGLSDHLNVAVLQNLRWTAAGAVDYQKTAEELVLRGLLGSMERFKLACLYCLEDHIPILWEDLPRESKKSFYRGKPPVRVKYPRMQLFLPRILRKLSTIDSWTTTNSFEKSVYCGNRTLAEYCLNFELTEKKREASLYSTTKAVLFRRVLVYDENDFRRKKIPDVVCFLLSQLTPEEQIRIFRSQRCNVLSCFLEWPFQDLFMDVADVIWTFLPESEYSYLVSCINESIKSSGYYFPDFFQKLFLRSPAEFRKCFVDEEIQNGYFFYDFFICEDTETIRVIFRNIDAEDRVRLVSSKHGLDLICRWYFKWDLVEVFLCAAMLSQEQKKILKERFIKFVTRRYQKYRHSFHWLIEDHRLFFEFVEETDASTANKRSLEDETLTKTKKLCYEKKENVAE